MKNLVSLLFTVLLPAMLAAQCITIDKDGYTNIREKPDGKSTIVGKVHKYQVFHPVKDICMSDGGEKSTANWEYITTDYIDPIGYIYKKHLMNLEDMPMIKDADEENNDGNRFRIVCQNDSIKVLLIAKAFDKNTRVAGQRVYGVDGWEPARQLDKIEITYNTKKYSLSTKEFKRYCDPNFMYVRIGTEGELYINISGGDGSGGYGVWLSVLNGEVLYSIVEEC